jgi:hypothetical protein
MRWWTVKSAAASAAAVPPARTFAKPGSRATS